MTCARVSGAFRGIDREAFDLNVVETVDDETGGRVLSVGRDDNDRARYIAREVSRCVGEQHDRRVGRAAAERLEVAFVIGPWPHDETIPGMPQESARRADTGVCRVRCQAVIRLVAGRADVEGRCARRVATRDHQRQRGNSKSNGPH
jgi:hypothetical protein